MKKKLFTISMQLIFFLFITHAQTKTIKGRITHSVEGLPIPGVTVIVKGTTIGTTTNADGVFSLEIPENVQSLIFSFIGMKTEEKSVLDDNEINLIMVPDVFSLDEVIVSGVAASIPRKKLSITVEKLSEDEIKNVPATSVGQAIQGKVPGITVVSGSGNPASESIIRVRGAASLVTFQEPMIILDGAIIEGGMNDINMDDVESLEIVKGAAATSLYGSRAGNGVVVIYTKRGANIAKGRTSITLRSEFGRSALTRKLPLATHHQFVLDSNWQDEKRFTKYDGITYSSHPDSIGWPVDGTTIIRNVSEDNYMDNPYMITYNHQEEFFQPGNYMTNYISLASNLDKTNLYLSYDNSQRQGIVFATGGFKRNNLRLNVDHRVSKKIKLSVSNIFVSTKNDNISSGNHKSWVLMPPDADLFAKNFIDGSDYRIYPSAYGNNKNPLYVESNKQNNENKNRYIGTINASYLPFNFLEIDVRYSIDFINEDWSDYYPKGALDNNENMSDGYLAKGFRKNIGQNFQATLFFHKTFGRFNTKFRLSYLYENIEGEFVNTDGSNFIIKDVRQFSAIPPSEIYANSGSSVIRAKNYFGILDLDYDDKYIGSFLLRYDGSSLFGENQRWNPYFRISGAYRITEDLNIPGFQELKLRVSYGTSGVRPVYGAKDETFEISEGIVKGATAGNKDLKPATIKELEFGLEADLLKRFNLAFTYSETDAEDQIVKAPAFAYTGFPEQWRNVGTLHSTSFEAHIQALIINHRKIKWSLKLTGFRIRQKVTRLDIPAFTQSDFRYIEEGIVYGNIWGQMFLRSLEDFDPQLERFNGEDQRYEGLSIDDFMLNSDGYVIKKGTEGTIYENPEILLDENGSEKKVQIGDGNPDFNMYISNNLQIGGFSLYFLFDWQQCGDIYNDTKQWNYLNSRAADVDQYGKPGYQKKTDAYYQNLYNVNYINNHFVESGTFLKLRELSLSYSFSPAFLSHISGNLIKSIRLSVIGRNLYTWTWYTGLEPEVAESTNYDATGLMRDYYNYPNYSTLSGSIQIIF